ncbi:MAG: T9SS type A sorting domain-containing protein [Muribaculaceae bacterium]
MTKRLLLLIALVLAAIGQLSATRNWDVATADYSTHAVVYAALADETQTRITPSETADVTLGAFIDNECRAICSTPSSGGTTEAANGIYTLKIGVTTADAGKAVTFVLKCGSTEYTLQGTLNVTGNDETIGGIPSNPFILYYIEPKDISIEDFYLNVGDKVTLADYITITGDGAIKPDNFTFDVGNNQEYIEVNDGVLTAIAPNTAGLKLNVSYNVISGEITNETTVYIYQPITSMTLTDPNVSEITVNINDGDALTAALNSIITVLPENTTERVEWSVAEENANAFTFGEDQNGAQYITPLAIGTFTLTASCLNQDIDPINITVNVLSPVTGLNSLYPNGIFVVQGDELNQYLPYLYSVEPSDATDAEEVVFTFSGTNDDNEEIFSSLSYEGIGTVYCGVALGTGKLTISHPNIQDALEIPVTVVKGVPGPKEGAYEPISIAIKSSELETLDITETLASYVTAQSKGNWGWSEFSWESSSTDIVEIGVTTSGIFAVDYGTTTMSGSKTVEACGFDGEGNFNSMFEYTGTIIFDVNIITKLESISFDAVKIGCEDVSTLTIKTEPEGYILSDVIFTIPTLEGNENQPLFTLERVDDTNNWTLTPLYVGVGKLEVSTEDVQTTGEVAITQHLNLAEGWNWISVYAGSAKLSSDGFDNIQEVRSQSQLVYNDPMFGFFGPLNTLDGSSSYKVDVKDGVTFDYTFEDASLYSATEGKTITLRQGWNWVNNPYCRTHSFADVFANVTLPDDSRVIAHEGFQTTYNGSWTGDLTAFTAGAGYLLYNAGNATDITLPEETSLDVYVETSTATASTKSATVRARMPILNYNPRQFANNMTIIAELSGVDDTERYSVVPFVGDECRGASSCIEGRYFITVHGASQETVSFRLLDNETGELKEADTTIAFADMAGTMAQPLMLQASISGIGAINADDATISVQGDRIIANGANVKVYSINGTEVSTENLGAGVYIVKVDTANGIVSKKVTVKGF